MHFSRRGFLQVASFSAVSCALPGWADNTPRKIARIETFPVVYPTTMRFKFFEGPSAKPGRPAVLVKITCDDGTTGWGESVPVPRWSYETLESAITTIDRYLAPVLLGMNVFDLERIHRAMDQEIAPSFSTGAPITKAGIDLALHDLIGKLQKKNVAALWGRETPDSLLLSWTLNPKTLDDLPEMMEKGKALGFTNFNVKVAPDLSADLELVRHVREAAPDGFLWADANGGYDLDTALEAAPKLADAGVPVLEQPIPINQISGYQRLQKQGALPILLDEGMVSPVELEEYIKLGCCDGVAMKPARCGGLVSARAQVELVQREGLMFLGSGLTDPDVSLAASLILYGAYGLQYPAALNGPQFLGTSILTEPFVAEAGRVRIPKGPGLGVEVDEEKLMALVEASKS